MLEVAQLSEKTRELALNRYRLLEQDRTLRSVTDEAGVSFRTLQRWVAQYRRFGLVGLVRKGREDVGSRRKLSPSIQVVVEGLALERPRLAIVSIHRRMRTVRSGSGRRLALSIEHHAVRVGSRCKVPLAVTKRDRFFVYEVPIPAEYAQTKGKRHIAVTLAFDPPTRHSRSAYVGVQMSFRLIRGKSLEWVREHYRKRNTELDGDPEKLQGKYDCSFEPPTTIRERGTLQHGVFNMSVKPSAEYGGTYYLVVRCERQWFPDDFAKQRFALVVELAHTEDVRLYERVDQRGNIRVRA